jgi:predicted TIM-barrel fold metal-dependent hydrolase
MTNGGQINISGLGQADVALALQRCNNLYIDTAGIYRQDFIEEVITTLGGRRVLFASGTPYFDQRYEIQRVLKANVSAEALKEVQSENALQLLGLVD